MIKIIMINFLKILSIVIFLRPSPILAAVSRSEYNSILDEFKAEYTSELRRNGLRFKIINDWNEKKLYASIKIPKQVATLTVSGGYAKQNLMTPDSFRMVICHELGHIFGGAPKKSIGHWTSIEGQADYYATAKCMKRMIVMDDNFKERVMNASLRSGKMLAIHLKEDPAKLELNPHKTRRVLKTYTLHPSPQCRIDTMVAGLNCNVSETEKFSDKDPNIGACLHKSIDKQERLGARPTCWYRAPTKRFRCTTNLKLPFHLSKMPVITLFWEDFRDDNSSEVQMMFGVASPENYLVQRIHEAKSNKDMSIKHIKNKEYKLSLNENVFNTYKLKSVLKVDWNKLVLTKDSNQNVLFNLICTNL